MSLNHAQNEYARRLAESSRTPAEFKVDAKVYFHHHNYAKFHFDLGGSRVKSAAFANYRYITDDKREQDQLDLVADVPGSFIYTVPDSDVAALMQAEQAQELKNTLLQTAVAVAQTNNQQFDPNAQTVPVQVQNVTATPLQAMPVHQPAGTGLQHTMSGTQAIDPIAARLTQAADQTKPPMSAAEAAAARLAAMTAQVNQSQQPQSS